MSDNMDNSDTTHCFLDGSPKQMGFFDRSHANKIHWPDFDVNPYNFDSDNNAEVTIIRPILFFRKEQKITLGKLREFFTPKAIKLFEVDDYIKINNLK